MVIVLSKELDFITIVEKVNLVVFYRYTQEDEDNTSFLEMFVVDNGTIYSYNMDNISEEDIKDYLSQYTETVEVDSIE